MIITLVFFCLCIENKENAKTITTTTSEAEITTTVASSTTIIEVMSNCASFSCEGSVETVSGEGNVNTAYCDDVEKASIRCLEGEGADTSTGEAMVEYSMCCTKEGMAPSVPTCEGCADGTVCGNKNKQMRCSCRDINNDGAYEVCRSELSSGCDKCADGTACDQVNDKKELCKCAGQITHDAGANDYMDCSLAKLCNACSDGTACGEKNSGSELCECTPEGASDTCILKRQMTCEKGCQLLGYTSGYCGDWIQNPDDTISECAGGDYSLYQNYLLDVSLTDCVDNSAPDASKKTICCCKGEPANDPNCPVIKIPSEPMDCIEEPGYLKDPKTGECCWYRATCYGPDGWQEYDTKAECQNPIDR